MENARIIVVEDELIVAEDIRICLERLGHSVVGAFDSGEELLENIERTHPDMILMDITLKGRLDGIETVRRLRRGHYPVVFLTAHGDHATLKRVQQTDPDGYLIKPFTMNRLQLAVSSAFEKYHRKKAQ